jgi:hypothetical protein
MEVPERKVEAIETGGHSPPVYVEKQESLPGLAPEPTPVQGSLPGIPYIPGEITYTARGKEVLKDFEHYADAVTSDAAECIARAMNAEQAQADWAYLLARAK